LPNIGVARNRISSGWTLPHKLDVNKLYCSLSLATLLNRDVSEKVWESWWWSEKRYRI